MWQCPECDHEIKHKLRFPVICRCGYRDYGRANDTSIEWCDDPPDFVPSEADAAKPKRRRGGPGTILKRKLWWFAFVAGKKCKCNKHARQMDREGPDWCEANIGLLVECLRESHAELPSIVRVCVPFAEALVRKTIEDSAAEARTLTVS